MRDTLVVVEDAVYRQFLPLAHTRPVYELISGAMSLRERIDHILEANGAFFDGHRNKGHAQKNQNISFNTIQPYPEGDLDGLYPTILIRP